jgi:CarD family transcriptional regulator
MYQIGEVIVHPMHGAGFIDGIENVKIGGVVRQYYVFRLPVGGMNMKIPVENSAEIGIRPLISSKEADELIEAMNGIEVEMTSNWNKRYRENMLRIKSGNLLEVARVIKGLMTRDAEKGLSTGERKMLRSAKQILISEIVLAKKCGYDEVEQEINRAMV